MKKQLLLLALTLGTQLSAETLISVLGTQGQRHLNAIQRTQIADFQRKKITHLTNLLEQDMNALTLEKLNSILTELENFPINKLEAQNLKLLIEKMKPLLEQKLAAPATVGTRTKTVSFANSTLGQESETDAMPELLLPAGVDLNQLLQSEDDDIRSIQIQQTDSGETKINGTEVYEMPTIVLPDGVEYKNVLGLERIVRTLNTTKESGESSSDINANTVVEKYKNVFEKLIENEWTLRDNEDKLSEKDCNDLLLLFFLLGLGLKIRDISLVFSDFVNALVALQNEMWEAREELSLPIHPSLRGNRAPLTEKDLFYNESPDDIIDRLKERERLEKAKRLKETEQMVAQQERNLASDLNRLANDKDKEIALLKSLEQLVAQAKEEILLHSLSPLACSTRAGYFPMQKYYTPKTNPGDLARIGFSIKPQTSTNTSTNADKKTIKYDEVD